MAKLMRCHTPHWQGNTFVDAGTVVPSGSPSVIPIYFEAFSVDEPSPEPAPAESEPPKRGRPRKADSADASDVG